MYSFSRTESVEGKLDVSEREILYDFTHIITALQALEFCGEKKNHYLSKQSSCPYDQEQMNSG